MPSTAVLASDTPNPLYILRWKTDENLGFGGGGVLLSESKVCEYMSL